MPVIACRFPISRKAAWSAVSRGSTATRPSAPPARNSGSSLDRCAVTTTASPRSSSARAVCDPIDPRPPVMSVGMAGQPKPGAAHGLERVGHPEARTAASGEAAARDVVPISSRSAAPRERGEGLQVRHDHAAAELRGLPAHCDPRASAQPLPAVEPDADGSAPECGGGGLGPEDPDDHLRPTRVAAPGTDLAQDLPALVAELAPDAQRQLLAGRALLLDSQHGAAR